MSFQTDATLALDILLFISYKEICLYNPNTVIIIKSENYNSIQVSPERWSAHLFYPHACLHNELSVPRKLARKRKETMSSTRQEMTVMVSSMDKSYAEQGTSCDEAFSFMDTHNLNGRCECCAGPALRAALGFPGFQVVLGVRKQNLPENS